MFTRFLKRRWVTFRPLLLTLLILFCAQRVLAASGSWLYPVPNGHGCWISGRYFQDYTKIKGSSETNHTGMDIACVKGTPVLASHDGPVAVAQSGWLGYFGYDVFIYDEVIGDYSFYAHMSELYVSKGQTVNRGDLIGASGCMPGGGACHLHWGRSTVPPEKFFSFITWETHARIGGQGWEDPYILVSGYAAAGETYRKPSEGNAGSGVKVVEKPDFYADFVPEEGYAAITEAFWAEFDPDENTPLGVSGIHIEESELQSVPLRETPQVLTETPVAPSAPLAQNNTEGYQFRPIHLVWVGIVLVMVMFSSNVYRDHRIKKRNNRRKKRKRSK